MKNLILIIIMSLMAYLCYSQCPGNLTSNNGGSNITVYVYDSNFNVIDTIICVQAGQSGNVNCNLSGGGVYFSIVGYNCIYDSNGSVVPNAFLPIELISFEGYNKFSNNILEWVTASEHNNDYFTIERSDDGENWEIIGTIDGAGNSTNIKSYNLVDNSYRNVINYYRLSQTDFDGTIKTHNIISIDNTVKDKVIVKTVNLIGQEIDDSYTGLRIVIFSDGTSIKKIGK
jgi:hypothetical protein